MPDARRVSDALSRNEKRAGALGERMLRSRIIFSGIFLVLAVVFALIGRVARRRWWRGRPSPTR